MVLEEKSGSRMSRVGMILSFFLVLTGMSASHAKSTEFKLIDEKISVLKTDVRVLNQKQKAWMNNLLRKWCRNLRAETRKLYWRINPCKIKGAKIGGLSVKGRPLVYFDFGDPNADNTTLILSMVHPDEVTPLYVGIETISWVKSNISRFPNNRVIIAPLVNPDGFYLKRRTRVNARGIDVNRNFDTADWRQHAVRVWKKKYRSNKRRYPGIEPNSEPETIFQRNLIYKFKPNKILSIHAPLNFMDYDGPNVLTLKKFPKEYIKECLKLRSKVKAVSGGFFVGSLGNYAGQERGIPTLTLELPTADARKAKKYWSNFKKGIKGVIQFRVPNYQHDLGNEASSLVLNQ